MYQRKWTKMEWWDSIRLFKQYNILDYDDKHRIIHMFPNALKPLKLPKDQVDPKEAKLTSQLTKDLLKKYPDLKYEPLQKTMPGQIINTFSHVGRFILKQKKLIEEGYEVDKAFEITEKLFQDRLQRKIDQSKLTHGLAMSNRARSFLNYYQQQSEYESRLKVMRMKRDISRYEESLQKFEEEMKQYDDDSIQEPEDDYGDQEDIYQRVLYQVINQRVVEKDGSKNPNRDQIIDEFMTRTANMFDLYYERAAIKDRLDGLTDQEIKNQIRDSPSKIKRRTKKLRKKLENLGVSLNSNGIVEYSEGVPDNVKKMLQNNPSVKQALMLEQMEYEFPHQEHKFDKAIEFKQKLAELEQTQDYSTLKEIRQDFFGDLKLEQEDKTGQDVKSLEDQVKQEYQKELIQPIAQSQATYKLFETYEERQLRIESKWLKLKIKQLEQSEQSHKSEKFQKTINSLRRLKFRIDQKSMKETSSLLFDEHEAFNEDELMVDQEINMEELYEYFKQPMQKINSTEQTRVDDQKVLHMIGRKQVYEDLINPFEEQHQQKYTERDSQEYHQMQLDIKRKAARERQLAKSHAQADEDDKLSENQKDYEDQAADNYVGRNKDKADQEDKKKLVQFLKKAKKGDKFESSTKTPTKESSKEDVKADLKKENKKKK